MINFASLRSAYEATIESMNFPQIRTIAIIAEGIPENLTRKINKEANNHGVTIIGEKVFLGGSLGEKRMVNRRSVMKSPSFRFRYAFRAL